MEDQIALVIRLHERNGRWFVEIDGTHPAQEIALQPITLIVRLRASDGGKQLRGRIGLANGERWTPIQSDATLVRLLGDWLRQEGAVEP